MSEKFIAMLVILFVLVIGAGWLKKHPQADTMCFYFADQMRGDLRDRFISTHQSGYWL